MCSDLLEFTVSVCSAMKMLRLMHGCLQWMSTMRITDNFVNQNVPHHLLLFGIVQSVQGYVTQRKGYWNFIRKKAAQKVRLYYLTINIFGSMFWKSPISSTDYIQHILLRLTTQLSNSVCNLQSCFRAGLFCFNIVISQPSFFFFLLCNLIFHCV